MSILCTSMTKENWSVKLCREMVKHLFGFFITVSTKIEYEGVDSKKVFMKLFLGILHSFQYFAPPFSCEIRWKYRNTSQFPNPKIVFYCFYDKADSVTLKLATILIKRFWDTKQFQQFSRHQTINTTWKNVNLIDSAQIKRDNQGFSQP